MQEIKSHQESAGRLNLSESSRRWEQEHVWKLGVLGWSKCPDFTQGNVNTGQSLCLLLCLVWYAQGLVAIK